MTTGPLDIESGFGIVEPFEGPPPPLAENLSYKCTFVLPSGVHEHVPGIRPNVDRFPSPLMVRAHRPGVTFPAFRVNDQIQTCMPLEMADFGPCPASGRSQGYITLPAIMAAVASATTQERAAFARMMKEYL